MKHVDVLIVGGGPAGSTCAWKLREAGADVAIVDRAVFPRHKPCAGWITPEVVNLLDLDLGHYGTGRTLQRFMGFTIATVHGRGATVRFDRPVSYGICRAEFDDYLLRRSGSPVIEGVTVRNIRRAPRGWIVNDAFETPLLVGAGGYFCPVVHALGFTPACERAVVAEDTEFTLSPAEPAECTVDPELPQLFLCDDLRGYAWVVRKGDRVNVGLGRRDPHALREHVDRFLATLAPPLAAQARRGRWHGHAYLLRDESHRIASGDGFLLLGDAAGLAYANSGEGVRPAVISGLLAARTIVAANGRTAASDLMPYSEALMQRFPRSRDDGLGSWLPDGVLAGLVRQLIARPWFARRVINHEFLRPGVRVAA